MGLRFVNPESFEKDMRYLAGMGYNPYNSLDDLEAMLKEEDEALGESVDRMIGTPDYLT